MESICPPSAAKGPALLILFLIFSLIAMAQISPLDFGLREAQDGISRYNALYSAHVEAGAHGLEVSYEGIDTLEITLPPDFQSIPLPPRTDFGGLVLHVTNNERHGALFAMHNPTQTVDISKQTVDCGDYKSHPELASGDKLLILNDQNPWTERIGYGYKVYRQDLIWIHDGQGMNTPIAPWNSETTLISASFATVDTCMKVFRGLTLLRTAESQFKTYCLQASAQYNLLIEDVHVTTPRSRMIADGVFGIANSAKVAFRNVTVNGTYSGYGRTRNYGYAFSLNNLWGTTFEQVVADGNWGVFGTNNLSDTKLTDCDINRFDIHCYGKDIYFRSCKFFDLYNQFSSMAGIVYFEDCEFTNFTPVLIESSYNAFTAFTVEMVNCTFNTTASKNYMIEAGRFDEERNTRPELLRRYWPRLKVSNLTVNCPQDVKSFYFYRGRVPNENGVFIDNIDDVAVDGLTINNEKGQSVNLYMSKYKVKTRRRGAVTMEDLRFAGETKATGGATKSIIDNITRTE